MLIMPNLTIYQKPTCSTCRDAMRRLAEAGVDYDAINYIIEPPSREKLAELARKMELSPRDLIRTREPEYQELGLADTALSDEQLLDAMAEHPSLIQRPIIEYGDHAVLARPADRVTEAMRAWGIGR
ncbi:MAG: arsC [Chlorobi bacterium]|nr:arsC [Chlorobiota bacterium]